MKSAMELLDCLCGSTLEILTLSQGSSRFGSQFIFWSTLTKMDVGNISNRTARCIAELDNLSKDKLGKVCKYFLQSLVKGSSNVALEETLDESLCAVSTLLLEAAKTHSTTDQLK